MAKTSEHQRIEEKNAYQKDWHLWGPYVSERQWGTVREDYSPDGEAWDYFPFEDAKSRAYRWGEDGIAGISDRNNTLCFAVSLWNKKDKCIKERLFGLSNNQGNHGEDVKEVYFHLDNTPTHSYMKYLYKYPHKEFPYEKLIEENRKRGLKDKEYELSDTGVFRDDAYFDVYIDYAKNATDDILIKITVANRCEDQAEVDLLPTLWFRNKWSFHAEAQKPTIESVGDSHVIAKQDEIGEYHCYFDTPNHQLFTENETNNEVIFGEPNAHPYKKDLFNDALLSNDLSLPTGIKSGTKFSPLYNLSLKGYETKTIHIRLTKNEVDAPFQDFDCIFNTRKTECEQFYDAIIETTRPELYHIQKSAFSAMLWSKQFYSYNVEEWLNGDLTKPNPSPLRQKSRNSEWKNIRNHDILLMPDKWEYPWYAAWDSAFHCITMAHIDLEFAKKQLLLFTKEWYMHPNGQIPAYEWSFSDVNPPVQAWAALMIYTIEKEQKGKGDVTFLKRIFNKLGLNFTWWVNRTDPLGNNLFEGGFLGMDNIGVFDRSKGIPGNARLEQVDGTAWMALYCLTMLKMSLLISQEDSAYEDMATKYFSHFISIAEAMNLISEEYGGIWDDLEGFFYDKIIFPDGTIENIRIRSLVGMSALIAVLHIPEETFKALPRFKRSFDWFKANRMNKLMFPIIQEKEDSHDILLSLIPRDRIDRLMEALLDEEEFLSPYGIRSLSKIHKSGYKVPVGTEEYTIGYDPAESTSNLFGGNSNWRGPIWMPINYLLMDSLMELHRFYQDEAKYPFPTGSDNEKNFKEISFLIGIRLVKIFLPNKQGKRPVHLLHEQLYATEYFHDYITFYEYYHGDNGRGIGASHQTGWSALIANLMIEWRMRKNE